MWKYLSHNIRIADLCFFPGYRATEEGAGEMDEEVEMEEPSVRLWEILNWLAESLHKATALGSSV
jgi:hypothetical protein